MSRRNVFISVAAVAGVALFLVMLVQLLLLRYQRGDLYPASSTLRPDPLGTRAFYEALPGAGHYDVSRGFVSLRRELAQKPVTLLVLGLDASDLRSFTPDEIDELDGYVRQGGRVVVTLTPPRWAGSGDEPLTKDKAKKEKSADKNKDKEKPLPIAIPQPPGKPKTEEEKYERETYRQDQETQERVDPDRYVPDKFHPSLQAVWGFGWTDPGEKKSDAEAGKKQGKTGADADSSVEYSPSGDVLAVRSGLVTTEDKVPWESPVSFLRLEPAWQVDYRAKGKPVLIERKWGRGEIIVASDSYFLSNEALRDDREPRLLAWLAGPPGPLLFDETHLGTQEQEGVMVLARRYHIEGYLYGLVLVTGLFLWRQSVPLVPPAPAGTQAAAGGAVSGKDSRSGLVNLLRRNIAPRELLGTCFAEWRRHGSAGKSAARTAEMETLLAAADTAQSGRIVEIYRQLCELNTHQRGSKPYANQP